MSGLAVYTPGVLRHCTVKLLTLPGVDYSKGKLTVLYSTPSDAKNIPLATADLILDQHYSIDN